MQVTVYMHDGSELKQICDDAEVQDGALIVVKDKTVVLYAPLANIKYFKTSKVE